MKEYTHVGYYNDVANQKFIDPHISIKVSLEWFLSKLLFKGDVKKVLYSAPEIVFRKRIEYIDSNAEYDEEAEIKPESLELPFASYFATGDPEPDDRSTSVSAAQSIIGEWDQDLNVYVRSLAVKQTYKAKIFFARRDDVRLAQQLLMWEKEPKFPIRMYNTVEWRHKKLTIPVNVTIENINTSPEYNEIDWLTKNRIFPVEVEMSVRTYQIYINNLGNVYQLPIRFSNVVDDYDEDNPPGDYITEKVILKWVAEKFDIETDEQYIDFESDEIKALIKSPYILNMGEISEAEKLEKCMNVPTQYTTDVVESYFTTDSSSELNRIAYNDIKSTGTTAVFDFVIKPSTFKYFDYMTISIPNKAEVKITDCKAKTATLEGLTPGSEYKVTVTVYATDGTIKHYFLTITTPADANDESPTPEKINKAAGLVGMRLF